MQRKELDSYVNRIMELNLTNWTDSPIEKIGPIINELIYFLYWKSNGGTKTTKKHIISQALLRNFAIQPKKSHVRVNGIEELKLTDDWMFCLPPKNKHFWQQRIENFFNFIEDHGADALRHFSKQLDSQNSSVLIAYNVNPLSTSKETTMRLLLALYLAMHIMRQRVAERNYLISNADFLDEMKSLTAALFFHVWTWCKVESSTFVVPIRTVVTLKLGDAMEYIFPITPKLALFVSLSNWDSYLLARYIQDEIRVKAGGASAMESGLINSSEKVGQQKFMIQNGTTSYTLYHSNSRLSGRVKNEDFVFDAEIFSEVTDIIKKSYPLHVVSEEVL